MVEQRDPAPHEAPAEGAEGAEDAESLERLRQLLVGDERRSIEEVRERVEAWGLDPDQLAQVLPDAVLLRNAATGMKRGGVGYYPRSDFVHLDTGRFRTW